jgi:hypothetical protein
MNFIFFAVWMKHCLGTSNPALLIDRTEQTVMIYIGNMYGGADFTRGKRRVSYKDPTMYVYNQEATIHVSGRRSVSLYCDT